MNLFINIEHLSILVVTAEDELIKKLQEEFHFFCTGSHPSPNFTVELYQTSPPALLPMRAHKVLSHALIYYQEDRRYVDYHGKALLIQQGKNYSLYCADSDFLFELAFLTIHSLMGELLEDLGRFRIHALAGTYQERDFILMLPSGGGKSSMLMELLRDPEVKIISDDSPIIDSAGRLHSFPSKISLSHIPASWQHFPWMKFTRALHPPKYLLSLSHLSERINPSPHDSRPLLIQGVRSSFKEPQWEKMNPLITSRALMENMILGIGLPQVIELFLSFRYLSDLGKMGKSFLKRSMAAYRLFRGSEHYYFTLSLDIKDNCQKLKDIIHEKNSRK